MKIHFKGRKEARNYCKTRKISYGKITDTGNKGPYRWVVESDEVQFEVGKTYRLVDAGGFRNSGISSSITQSIQANEIVNRNDGLITVDRINDSHVLLRGHKGSHGMLYMEEAKFFVEEKEAKETPVATVAIGTSAKPAPVQPSVVKPAPAQPSNVQELNAILDEETPAKKRVHLDHNNFQEGHKYRLLDEHRATFTSNTTGKLIADVIDREHGGIYEITRVAAHSSYFKTKGSIRMLFRRERKYFEDVTNEDIKSESVAMDKVEEAALAVRKLDTEILELRQEYFSFVKQADVRKTQFEASLKALIKDRAEKSIELTDLILGK